MLIATAFLSTENESPLPAPLFTRLVLMDASEIHSEWLIYLGYICHLPGKEQPQAPVYAGWH